MSNDESISIKLSLDKALRNNPVNDLGNARKRKGASKKIMETLLVAKLFKDDFIVKTDSRFEIHISDDLKKKYGSDESTLSDIRVILTHIIIGLYLNGTDVRVGDILVRGKDVNAITVESKKEKRPPKSLDRALNYIGKHI